MKLLMENWRRFLNESDGVIKDRYKLLDPFVFVYSDAGPNSGRPIVVVETSEGPTAFYRSTGRGTPEENSEGMWLPFGGIAQRSTTDAWLVKMPSSHPQARSEKFPREGTEFYDIGRWLEKNIVSGRKIVGWWDWIQSAPGGWPSYQELEDLTQYTKIDKYTGKKWARTGIDRVDYARMILNAFLMTKGALKKDWAQGRKFYGSTNDPPEGQYTLADVKRIAAK